MTREQKRIIRWEDPPPVAQPGRVGRTAVSQWDQVAAELRANPGKWAAIADGSAGAIAGILYRAAFLPLGAFEATTRTTKGRTVGYIRYIGGAP